MSLFNIERPLIYKQKSETFLEIFIFMSMIISTNIVFFKYHNRKEGIINKIKTYLSRKLNININNEYLIISIELFFLFIHSFIHLYILYVLFGYGVSNLGPCQKIIKCK